MSVVKTAMLLLLLAAIGTNADHHEGCDHMKMMAKEDLHKAYGDWVLVWAVADYQEGIDVLPNISSSHVELHLLPDNHTIVFNERNMFLDKTCVNYFINMLVSDSDNHTMSAINAAVVEKNGVLSPYNESGDVDFYETCSDCLMIVYKSKEGRYLLNYRSEGHHHDVEQMKANQAGHEKHAECLGFSHDHPFIYDGLADFCHKNSSSEVEATEGPTAVVEATEGPTVVVEATEGPTVVVEATEGPTVVVEATEGPTVVVEATEGPTVVVEATEGPTVVVEATEGPTVVVEATEGPTVVVEATEGPTAVVEAAVKPGVVVEVKVESVVLEVTVEAVAK